MICKSSLVINKQVILCECQMANVKTKALHIITSTTTWKLTAVFKILNNMQKNGCLKK